MQELYWLLAPGGTFLVGNMVPSSPSRWFMELHLDWFLVYRERSEMLEFARLGQPNARIGIVEEATGVESFVSPVRSNALEAVDAELQTRWAT